MNEHVVLLYKLVSGEEFIAQTVKATSGSSATHVEAFAYPVVVVENPDNNNKLHLVPWVQLSKDQSYFEIGKHNVLFMRSVPDSLQLGHQEQFGSKIVKPTMKIIT